MLLLGALLGTAVTPARCEGIEDINLDRSKFFMDHAVFADTGGANRLEVYYKVFNDGLNYVKKGDKYIANYEINVIVLGEHDLQVTGRSVERTYVLDSYELTKSDEGFLINQLVLPIPPGNYQLVCKLIDHNSNDVQTIEGNVVSHPYRLGRDLSDIQFIQEFNAIDPSSPFNKHGLAAVPAVERAIDAEEQKLGFYLEIYAADFLGRQVNLHYEVKAKRAEFNTEKDNPITIDTTVMGIQQFIDLHDLVPGDYSLKVKLEADGETVSEREVRFHIKWSLHSLLRNDFGYAVTQLKYVIQKDERKKLEQTPDSLREQAFEEWWKSKDPTPGTPENEFRDEYYRRIRYSNQYYSTVNREGWQTDRGSIYIRYGAPDDIDNHPFELGSKPYQVWYYFTQRRTFVFEDSRGDGDYQLQYPYDGDWRSRGTLGP